VIPHGLICASASGFISAWQIESGQNLWTIHEDDNSINAIGLSPDGRFLTSCGSDCAIRYYSLADRKLVKELTGKIYAQGQATGHGSRVFATVFMNENVIASSGWDDAVLLWDIRSGDVVRSIFGTHICGDAIAFSRDGRFMFTGSWRDKNQLQLWDVGSGKVTRSVTIGNVVSETV
jgi:WD40 repeat protein